MSTDDRLVTVARYDAVGEARLAKTRLDEAGVPCMVANADQSGLAPMFEATEGGVQIKVPARRAAEARALLGID